MKKLTLRFRKKRDGSVVMEYIRADGTTTWQHDRNPFFPFHDLNHYAVETTLGLKEAFLGLLASGWELSDFGTPWPRGPVPPEAIYAECLAGALDSERSTGIVFRPDEINTLIQQRFAEAKMPAPRIVTLEQMNTLRTLSAELQDRWIALPPDTPLELCLPEETKE